LFDKKQLWKGLFFMTEEETPAKTILVVEDDELIGAFLAEAISQETPYHPLLVSDGFEALRVTHDIRPSMFLLDYHLPRMNGIELYDELHAREGLETVPAILVSANLPLSELTKRGIPGIKKPFDLDQLLQEIEKIIV
jgi:DNA-binding response OmpR family regulator